MREEEIREAKKGSQEIKKKGYCAKQNSRKKRQRVENETQEGQRKGYRTINNFIIRGNES